MPPGTGDVQLSISQNIPIAGMCIVRLFLRFEMKSGSVREVIFNNDGKNSVNCFYNTLSNYCVSSLVMGKSTARDF